MSRRSLFISVANREFADVREQLRNALAGAFDVIVQPDFSASAADVVRKLDSQVKKCDLLVHIVGLESGTVAAAEAVKDFFDHVPRATFLKNLPEVSLRLGSCSALTYPQWEPWLAIHRGIDVIVYSVEQSGQPDFPQREHLANLKLARKHAHLLSDFKTAQTHIVADIFRHFEEIAETKPLPISTDIPETATYRKELTARVEDALNSRKIRDFGQGYIPRSLELDPGSPIEPESLELGQILNLYPGLSLCGEAGDGKTSWCLHLVSNLLKEDQRLPILIECRRLSDRLEEYFRTVNGGSRDETLAGIRHVLKSFLTRPFTAVTATEISEHELGIYLNSSNSVIVIEGFDELQSSRGSEASIHELFAVELVRLHHSLSLTSADLIISSRPSVVHLLDELRMPRLRPARMSRDDLQEVFVEAKATAEEQDLLADIFFNKLAGKPLYLKPLIKYFRTITGDINFLSLLVEENEAQFRQNAAECTRDPGQTLQKACLRQISLALVSKAVFREGDFRNLIASLTHDPETQNQLLRVVPHFLITSNSSQGRLLQFPHDEFRDFWIAESVLLGLAGTDQLRPNEELVQLLTSKEVLDKVVQLVHSGFKYAMTEICDSLVRIINESASAVPKSRRVRTTAALALGLLVRIAEIGQLNNLQCSDKCFQGLDAQEQRFLRVDFSRSFFGDARLQGAVFDECSLNQTCFDNAELAGAVFRDSPMQGSILKNAGMGGYRTANTDELQPTQFVDCSLDRSDWFNFRVILRGYSQFWTARQLEGSNWIALACSNGELLLFDKQKLEEQPRRLSTVHSVDVLDFDFSFETRLLVTTSRDRTVSLCAVNDDWSALRLIAQLNMPDHYPRCVAFTASGQWFGVTDRSGNVFFFETKKFTEGRGTEPDPASCRSLHTGPVMSLGLFSRGRNDEFFSAGYDGRVVEHQRTLKGSQNWSSKEIVSFANDEQVSTIRCILPWKAHGMSGLWIGDEAGHLRFKPLIPGKSDLVLAATTGSPIFRLGCSRLGNSLCAGLANGEVAIFAIDRTNTPIAARYFHSAKIPRGDIVRYCDFLDEDRVACVAWSGSFWVWSIRKRTFIYSREHQRSSWDSSKDHSVLRISPVTEIDKIINVSGTFKEYLTELSR